jgi:hypothetical protein
LFIGFDSFEELPEDWTQNWTKGKLYAGGAPPQIDDTSGNFIKGWFPEHPARLSEEFYTAIPICDSLRQRSVFLDAFHSCRSQCANSSRNSDHLDGFSVATQRVSCIRGL